jgi:hypothetical protein
MTVRRATDKERRKYGKEWISRRSKPIVRSTPQPAPWSAEAVAAYDRAALARNYLPPMLALNLRRIEKPENPTLRGAFDLYVPHWHFSLRGCLWHVSSRSEWVSLPNRCWIDHSGTKHYEPVVIFEDVYESRFTDSALVALHNLLAIGEAVAPKAASEQEHDQDPHHQPPMNGNGAAVHVDGHDDVPF